MVKGFIVVFLAGRWEWKTQEDGSTGAKSILQKLDGGQSLLLSF